MKYYYKEIDSCANCPFCQWEYFDCRPDAYICKLSDEERIICADDQPEELENIPDWCPLPDKESE